MTSNSQGKPLTMDLIFTKTKSDSLQNIKNLNLWGNDLEDLRLIEKMPNLEVVSLSVNRISTLKEFATCTRLQELYLRKNNISDINEIRHLVKLPTLKVLWLHDNQCSLVQNYREIVIRNLPFLIKLDNTPVTPEERIAAHQRIPKPIGSNEEYQDDKHVRDQFVRQSRQQGQRQPVSIKKDDKTNGIKASQKGQKLKGRVQVERNLEEPESALIGRNQNILMAVLSLMKELDRGSLEIIRRQSQNLMN